MYACMCVRGYVCGSSSDGGKGMYVRKVIMEIDTEAEVCKNPPLFTGPSMQVVCNVMIAACR